MVCKEIESRLLVAIEGARLSSKFRLSPISSEPTRTGSGVFKAESPLTEERRIIKIASPLRIKSAIDAYPLISGYFPTPEPRQESRNSLSFDFIEGFTLDQMVRQKPTAAFQVVDEVYQSTVNLWRSSIAPYNPDQTVYDHKVETLKTLGRLKSQLEKRSPIPFNYPVEVNGVSYPSLREIIEAKIHCFSEPKISVLDPGDANSQNIIVSPDGKWNLVDIERTGHYDPAYILARQIGQWAFYIEDPNGVIWDAENRFSESSIVYDPHRLPIAELLREKTKLSLGKFILEQGDTLFEERLRAYIFVFFARYAVLSESWLLKRYGQVASGPLLTEAIINSTEPLSVVAEKSKVLESEGPSRKLAVVIVNYNTDNLLNNCLDSLEKSLGGLDYQVVVVDNNSRDNSLKEAKFDRKGIPIKVLRNDKNLGFARATNQGIKEEEAEYYLLLNPDTQVPQGSIQTMVSFADANHQIGVLGPLIKKFDGLVDWRCRRDLTELNIFGRQSKKKTEQERLLPGQADTVSGACMLVRKTVIDQVGLLDESYFLGIEDVDWCFRIGNSINPASGQRWQVYFLPEAQIIHFGGQSRSQDKLRSSIELIKSMAIFADKNISPKRPRWQRILIKMGAYFYGLDRAINSLRYWQ